VNDVERFDFVREHTRLAAVPLVAELRVYRADAVTPVWFELARLLDDRSRRARTAEPRAT